MNIKVKDEIRKQQEEGGIDREQQIRSGSNALVALLQAVRGPWSIEGKYTKFNCELALKLKPIFPCTPSPETPPTLL